MPKWLENALANSARGTSRRAVHRAIISEIYGSSRERGCLYAFDTNDGETT
jgi:hypothetical protein